MLQSLIVDTLRKCRKAVAGMLLNNGANINAANNYGDTFCNCFNCQYLWSNLFAQPSFAGEAIFCEAVCCDDFKVTDSKLCRRFIFKVADDYADDYLRLCRRFIFKVAFCWVAFSWTLHFAGLLLPTIYLQSCIYDFILLGCIMSIMLILFFKCRNR